MATEPPVGPGWFGIGVVGHAGKFGHGVERCVRCRLVRQHRHGIERILGCGIVGHDGQRGDEFVRRGIGRRVDVEPCGRGFYGNAGFVRVGLELGLGGPERFDGR